ncbi:hypothetical protein [Thiocystis violacea]|uniref:hypothetical protein n=1 Tax=Thiocystis violacea TaxID=13725 RepID=UPI00190496FC|nr:hypothetical protein [Thiocystis violacea]MBK1722144.1 hypothetical protein [Thiocystis violacea]
MTNHIIHTANGRLAPDTPFSAVKQMVDDAVDSGNLVLHFHGGLVSQAKGRAIAERLTPEYQRAGAFPIFSVWESGALETIRNNLGSIAAEAFFRILLKRVSSMVRRKLEQGVGARAAGVIPALDLSAEEAALDRALDSGDPARLPAEPVPDAALTPLSDAEMMVLEAELQADPELQIAAQGVSAGLRDPTDVVADAAARTGAPVRAATGTLMDPAAVDALLDRPDPTARGLFSAAKLAKALVLVAARVIRRYLHKRDHGFHATVVEEILRAFYLANVGGTIWAQMKGDTQNSFGPDPERFGGTAVLSLLGERVRNGARPRVTLVGHSTGAVYIAHLLKVAETLLPAELKLNIVLLAPASTFALTAESFTHNRARIQGLRIFTMSDPNERKDRLVPVLYPHSLLYFVSGVVEPDADTPLIGMQRYYDAARYPGDRFPAVESFRHLTADVPHSLVWSVAAGGAGLETAALKHGDFDDEPTTLASLRHLIQKGF